VLVEGRLRRFFHRGGGAPGACRQAHHLSLVAEQGRLALEVYQRQKRVDVPDTGRLEEDLVGFVKNLFSHWARDIVGSVFRSLIRPRRSRTRPPPRHLPAIRWAGGPIPAISSNAPRQGAKSPPTSIRLLFADLILLAWRHAGVTKQRPCDLPSDEAHSPMSRFLESSNRASATWHAFLVT